MVKRPFSKIGKERERIDERRETDGNYTRIKCIRLNCWVIESLEKNNSLHSLDFLLFVVMAVAYKSLLCLNSVPAQHKPCYNLTGFYLAKELQCS